HDRPLAAAGARRRHRAGHRRRRDARHAPAASGAASRAGRRTRGGAPALRARIALAFGGAGADDDRPPPRPGGRRAMTFPDSPRQARLLGLALLAATFVIGGLAGAATDRLLITREPDAAARDE